MPQGRSAQQQKPIQIVESSINYLRGAPSGIMGIMKGHKASVTEDQLNRVLNLSRKEEKSESAAYLTGVGHYSKAKAKIRNKFNVFSEVAREDFVSFLEALRSIPRDIAERIVYRGHFGYLYPGMSISNVGVIIAGLGTIVAAPAAIAYELTSSISLGATAVFGALIVLSGLIVFLAGSVVQIINKEV